MSLNRLDNAEIEIDAEDAKLSAPSSTQSQITSAKTIGFRDVDNALFGAETVYEYEGPFQSAYTACYGSSKGVVVGRKLEQVMHRTLGGDGNYDQDHTSKRLKGNLQTKYPAPEGKGVYTFVGFGNHEWRVETGKTSTTDEVAALYEQLSPKLDEEDPEQSYLTYARADKEKYIPLPHAEVFKQDGDAHFIILQLDSDLLPYNEDYIANTVKTLQKLKAQYQDCPIVISMHHAPETYGIRRSDHKDAKKYLDFLEKMGIIDANEKKKILQELDQAYKEWEKKKEKNPERYAISPYSWNHIVSKTMERIYSEIDGASKSHIIATQSGHDHYAGLLVKGAKHGQPLAILAGNGAQEAHRFIGAGRQQVQEDIARGIEKNKVYGIDAHRRQDDAKYIRLGYGVWTLENNEPVYTQYYFRHLNLETEEVNVATRTTFKPGSVVIEDYLNHVDCTITGGERVQTGHEEPGLINKIMKQDPGYEEYRNGGEVRFDFPVFIENLKQDVKANPKSYHTELNKAFRAEHISLETMLKLKRLSSPSNNDAQLPVSTLEQIIKEYKESPNKGFFRKRFGSTTTIKELKMLLKAAKNYAALNNDSDKHGQSNKEAFIYRSEIEFILQRRDRRSNIFRSHKDYKGSSLTLFQKGKAEEVKQLTDTEEVIDKLGKAFGRKDA